MQNPGVAESHATGADGVGELYRLQRRGKMPLRGGGEAYECGEVITGERTPKQPCERLATRGVFCSRLVLLTFGSS